MIKPLSQSACKQAQAYYYDYICEEDIKPIPADKAEHIRQCAQCQAKINKLKYELFETAADKDDAERVPGAHRASVRKSAADLGDGPRHSDRSGAGRDAQH